MSESCKLTLAIPKGRIAQASVELLRRASLNLAPAEPCRRLMYDAGDAWLIEMRNSDVPAYVGLGVADAGIAGKDILLESGSDVYEPVDLGIARCRLSLIRPLEARGAIRRVASKYPRIARNYLRHVGISAEVTKLSGNVELACITGLADAVVDIVETGNTLRVNGLEEIDVIAELSARFVVNRAALKLKSQQLRPLIAALRRTTQTPFSSLDLPRGDGVCSTVTSSIPEKVRSDYRESSYLRYPLEAQHAVG
jgi:ATP phosphoribosyltransferase